MPAPLQYFSKCLGLTLHLEGFPSSNRYLLLSSREVVFLLITYVNLICGQEVPVMLTQI